MKPERSVNMPLVSDVRGSTSDAADDATAASPITIGSVRSLAVAATRRITRQPVEPNSDASHTAGSIQPQAATPTPCILVAGANRSWTEPLNHWAAMHGIPLEWAPGADTALYVVRMQPVLAVIAPFYNDNMRGDVMIELVAVMAKRPPLWTVLVAPSADARAMRLSKVTANAVIADAPTLESLLHAFAAAPDALWESAARDTREMA